MTDPAERIAKLETWSAGHEDQCKERYGQIRSDTKEIKDTLSGMLSKLDSSVSRIHDRLDGQDGRIGGLKVWVLTGAVGALFSALGYALTHWGPFK